MAIEVPLSLYILWVVEFAFLIFFARKYTHDKLLSTRVSELPLSYTIASLYFRSSAL